MYYIGRSSITLLVICSCLFTVADFLVARPVTYSFGDRIQPKAVDLQGSSAESKIQVARRQPKIPKKIEIIPSPEIKQTNYAQAPILPVNSGHSSVPSAVYNVERSKSKIKPETLKRADILTTISPEIKRDVKPMYYIRKKPTTTNEQILSASPVAYDAQQPNLNNNKLSTKKVLQKPLVFSYNNIQPNKDLKTAASHNDDQSHGAGNLVSVTEDSNVPDHAIGGSHIVEESEHVDHNNNEDSKEPKEWAYEKGQGKKQHSGHYSSEGEKGDESYDGEHEYKKAEKGHHDKEGHRGRYEDETGNKKSHYYDDELYGEYHKGEKGEKGSKYEDEGEYSKGHSTKGEHNIHKKEEYEKKREFYDEFHEGGDEEKHGAFHHESDYKKGGSKKVGHNKSENHKDLYGKNGHHEKGEHYHENEGHKIADGHDGHYKHKQKHGKKGGHHGAKKWGYKKGERSGGHLGGHDHHGEEVHGHHNIEPHNYGNDFVKFYTDIPVIHEGDHSHTHYIITHY